MSITKFSLIALAAATLSLSAMAGPDAAGIKGNKAQPEAFSAGLKLLKTYFETGNGNGAALASGFNPYGSTQTVNCTVTAGCYLIVNVNAQVAGIATVNPSAMTVKVDGAYVSAPFNTPVATTSFTVMNYQTGIPVAMGTHTVSAEVYVTTATALHRYNTEIKLYK